MINLIGAYVVGIMGIALLRHPLPLRQWDEALKYSHLLAHIVLIAGMTVLGIYLFFPAFGAQNSITSLPGFIFEGVNLWIHEAGHGFLAFAPTMLMIAGGTGLQIGLPAALLVYCISRSYFRIVPAVLFWLGGNLPNVGTYIADARAMKLPLLGGGEGTLHDWNTLLNFLHLLPYDTIIGAIVWWSGAIIVVVAIGWAIRNAVLSSGSSAL